MKIKVTNSILIQFCLVLLVCQCSDLRGQVPSSSATQSMPQAPLAVVSPFDADQSINRLVTRLVLKQMPHTYTRDKDWGIQKERWDGIKWSRDGWRLKTKRRKKLVNHGTWKKYTAELVDPQHQFDVSVTNIRQTVEQKLAFRINFTTNIRLTARQSEWVKGVQLYSIGIDGKASIRLSVDMTLGISLDPTHFPPVLVFTPEAQTADLMVDDFRIDHVGKLGGEFAIQVTRLARRELDDVITEKEVELVEKINKEIAENPDDLRVSLTSASKSSWAEKAGPFLPPAIKQAVQGAGSKEAKNKEGAGDRGGVKEGNGK